MRARLTVSAVESAGARCTVLRGERQVGRQHPAASRLARQDRPRDLPHHPLLILTPSASLPFPSALLSLPPPRVLYLSLCCCCTVAYPAPSPMLPRKHRSRPIFGCHRRCNIQTANSTATLRAESSTAAMVHAAGGGRSYAARRSAEESAAAEQAKNTTSFSLLIFLCRERERSYVTMRNITKTFQMAINMRRTRSCAIKCFICEGNVRPTSERGGEWNGALSPTVGGCASSAPKFSRTGGELTKKKT